MVKNLLKYYILFALASVQAVGNESINSNDTPESCCMDFFSYLPFHCNGNEDNNTNHDQYDVNEYDIALPIYKENTYSPNAVIPIFDADSNMITSRINQLMLHDSASYGSKMSAINELASLNNEVLPKLQNEFDLSFDAQKLNVSFKGIDVIKELIEQSNGGNNPKNFDHASIISGLFVDMKSGCCVEKTRLSIATIIGAGIFAAGISATIFPYLYSKLL